MGQVSRVVTTVDGIEVIEVTVHDVEGNPMETNYYVQGVKYATLREAREAAGKITS